MRGMYKAENVLEVGGFDAEHIQEIEVCSNKFKGKELNKWIIKVLSRTNNNE